MEIFSAVPFIPGETTQYSGPLARYLPPLPDGIVSSWLQQNVAAGGWVLDPFGAAPHQALEAARAGYRVLVTSNNPIDRLLLNLFANPPAPGELKAAVADLASSFKGTERIEPHLRSLYQTACNNCGREIMAGAFVWDRGATTPSRRIYHCTYCEDTGEHPATQDDEALAERFAGSSLHRSRALERVASPEDPDRQYVEEALDTYLPRSIYAIFTLLNKVENLPAQHRRPLTALFLSIFDQGNTLWQHPSQRARPRQLTIPSHYRENNIWLALEEAVEAWSQVASLNAEPVTVELYPKMPPENGGICLFEGRLKDLSEETKQYPIFKAAIAPLPRPNQAYWTLCALWAGWLWGRDIGSNFKIVLHRRRYDWAWHTSALQSAFMNLGKIVPTATPIFGYFKESEPGFISAAMVAAELAKFKLSGIAIRKDHTQIHWQTTPLESGKPLDQSVGEDQEELDLPLFHQICQTAAQTYLRLLSEPASYLTIQIAALTASLTSGNFHLPAARTPAETHSMVQNSLQSVFSTRSGFTRFGGSSASLETGEWWVEEGIQPEQPGAGPEIALSLADRIEIEIVRKLIKQDVNIKELDLILCRSFPGLFTPEMELIQTALDSYAENETGETGLWTLRSADIPHTRRMDLTEIASILKKLGSQLGYKINTSSPDKREIAWILDEDVRYVFYLTVSAVMSKLLTNQTYDPGRCLIVFPGSRAGLIAYKLQSDPRLRLYADRGWRFIKFRHVHRLSSVENLTRENIDHHLSLDPLTHQYQQMQLL